MPAIILHNKPAVLMSQLLSDSPALPFERTAKRLWPELRAVSSEALQRAASGRQHQLAFDAARFKQAMRFSGGR